MAEGLTATSAISENEGRVPSFSDVYSAYQKMVRGTLYRMCGPSYLDDLVQDCFIRIWNGLPNFDRRSSLKTWIYPIVVRVGIDHLRGNKKRALLVPLENWTATTEGHQKDTENKDLVLRGLLSLPLEQRVVLVLAIYEGLSVQEISAVTDSKEGTVKSRIFYAKKGMVEFLKTNGVSDVD